MAGADDEVGSARASLTRARDELRQRLEAEPSWRVLREIDRRPMHEAGAKDNDAAVRRRVAMANLDRAVPQWRTLASIERAIAALDAAASAAIPDVDLGVPSPDGSGAAEVAAQGAVPHVRVEAERTRYAPAVGRPAPQPTRRVETDPKPSARARRDERLWQRAPSDATQPPAAARGRGRLGQVAAALGLGGDGPARLSAIEAEVERLIRRDAPEPRAETPSPPPPSESRSPARGVSPAEVSAPPITRMGSAVSVYGDEAEVEIVYLEEPRPRRPSRPITKLADRLNRLGGEAAADGVGEDREAVVSLQPDVDEADVEIVALEDGNKTPAAPKPGSGRAR